jgi:hypothetical protein
LGCAVDPQVRPIDAGLELVGGKRNGRESPVDVGLCLLQAEQGLLAAAALRDVTQRRRATTALQASE